MAGAAPHQSYLDALRFPSLDGLRCLAILPVVFHHSTPRPLPGFAGKGPLGVHLFFAVSGFLITTLLVREKGRTGTLSLSRFYARRSLRIFPLYYAVLALYAARAWLFLPPSPMRAHFFHDLPFFATYTANVLVDFDVPHPVIFGFSWSLATEEQFYLLWPPVLRVFRRKGGPSLVTAGLLALDFVAERGLLVGTLGTGLALRTVTSISAPICLGSLLALALDDRALYDSLARILGKRASAPMLLGGLVLLVLVDAPLLSIHVVMVALVGSVCVRADHGLRALLEARPLVYVGTVSYGMYLIHVAVITLVKMLLPESARTSGLVFAAAVPLTIGLAALSYRFFERPFLELRARFRPAPSPGVTPT